MEIWRISHVPLYLIAEIEWNLCLNIVPHARAIAHTHARHTHAHKRTLTNTHTHTHAHTHKQTNKIAIK